ncbi:universal stress protein [Coralloluteibacterium stylophorae]|uniref:Universal stress protein n=1 Tax=Coralloluteibacterium stylophorae TaxID=1776034 RepID=A0A8J8AZ81_9GAMM|nr:universal stress protein [Coralloluteibacterium stylophorae]MBS7455574.1 universal stress protein [Coralloluteibacterium stylophorae]
MYRSILVPLLRGEAEAAPLQAACALTAQLGAELRVLVGMDVGRARAFGWEFMPAGPDEASDLAARAGAEALAEDVRRLLEGHRPPCKVVVGDARWASPARQAVEHAQVADLVVMGRPLQPTAGESAAFGMILLESGRPVLVIPSTARTDRRYGTVVLAWTPTREATRALHDALPLLAVARAVHVLTLAEGAAGTARFADVEAASVLPLLARHGVAARHLVEPRGDREAGEAILEHALRIGADLIVAGGHGRSRLAELVFGGATRTLYLQAPIPVLFSH